MRTLSFRLLSFLIALLFVPAAFAHDVTVTGTQSFASLDGSSSDHDGLANGVFTVNDGNLIVNGVVNCNDDSTESACSMAFVVSGNMTVGSGGALYAENRSGSGTGGAITLTVGGNLSLDGGAMVSTASKSSSGSTGGAITANVTGSVSLASGSTIDSGSANARGGAIAITAGGTMSVDGNVLSGPSRTFLATRLDGGAALDGGTSNTIGGSISLLSSTFAEPAMLVGPNGNIVSQGADLGAGPVTLDACGIQIRGLVAALSKKDGAAKISIRSGKDVLIDGRDLGASGTRMGRVRADAPTGTAINKGVDVFAAETVDVFGPSNAYFVITSHPGVHDSKSLGGLIRITSLEDAVNASGNVVDDGKSAAGDTGGTVEISAKMNVNLNTAVLRAVGDFNTNNPYRGGGSIHVRSYSGNVIWTNGLGEVRPVGSTSGLATADQGAIVLTACGTVDVTGTSFPVMGTATSVFPETHTGSCSPAAPSLPAGVPPLVTCNTPPVANDASASTNEDTTVTITLSGTDADGDPLTFSIVSGPANGSLGSIVPTGPTSATVNYTPNLNYNGADSFVYQANDGNGGTDNATVTITIAPVNDPPTFLAGSSVTVLEDSGAQTIANWASSISAGPADESGQAVTFTVTNDNPSLFSVQPALASVGTLTFTPAVNAYGSATITIVAQDNGGTANGGNDTSAPQTSSITVTGVNDEPSFVKGADQTVNEDAGAQTVSGWATSISAGPNETQGLTFLVSSDTPSLFSAGPAVSASGTLTYTPAANANGTATVTVSLQDDGGTANGGDDTSAAQTFTITVNAVNDEPSFTSGGNVTVLEDSGAYSAAWATAISAGPADESGQTLSFSVSNDNNALFSVQPAIAADGTLTFTTATNAFGSATVTVTLSDNGGTANGGADTSGAQTFTLTITAVNDEPSFTSGGNVTVNEDSGAYGSAWATAISAGPGETQALTFVASNDNNALFASQPAIAADGTLSFTPAANANGTATVTVSLQDDGGTANGGDDTSAAQTFTITVNAVNDEPSFTSGGNVTVLEDSGAYSAAWATAISAGPADESGQTLSFSVSNDNNALFSVQPAIASDGTLTFTTATNAFGSATVTVTLSDNGGTANGGDDTSAAQTFTLTITAVNDEPSFTGGGNVTVNEDSGAYASAWATAISAGPGETQALTFVASNDNNALFASQPAIAANGTLSFTPAADANGSATVTVYLQDDGGTANGGDDTSSAVTFTITVNAVNDAPSFVSGGNVTVNEDSGAYSAAWATSISAGPANESGQALTFNVTGNSNPSLFSVAPSLSASGVLSFTLAADASGSATITVTLSDDGGTANGGVDTSAPQSFTITINSVNDAPSFTSGGDVTVNEDSGAYSAAWATAISAGPGESGQTVTFFASNSNNALFSAQPSIDAAGVLTFTPAPNAYGTATVSVYAQDNGGTANGGVDTSATVTFTITVNGVNDPPAAGNDSWETEGNTELRVDHGVNTTPHVADTTTSGTGVLDNDADAVEGDPFAITGIVGCADTTAPFVCAVTGGTVTLESNGSFTFEPNPGATSATFQYTVTDMPSAGSPASANGTVNITIHDMIWYVNGGAASGGNGTSTSPFNDLSSLNGSGDVDGAGDYIFVHNSSVSGSISMETNQKLWGEGVGLIIPRNLNGNGSPATLVAAGTRPTVTAIAGDVVLVSGVTGVDVAGLNLNTASGNGIDVTSLAAGPATSVTIRSNSVMTTGAEGIDINAGSPSGTSVAIDGTNVTAMANGVDLLATDGDVVFSYSNGTVTSAVANGIVLNGSAADSLTVTGLANVTISGNTAGSGISITAARFDANPGTAAFDNVGAGSMNVGVAGDPVGGAALTLTGVSGDLSFASLNAHGGTTGVTIAGSGLFTGSAGMRVTSAGGAVTAAAGVGLSVSNASIGAANVSLTSVSSNGGANGILLSNTGSAGGLKILGTGSAGSGGTIQNTSSHGVSLASTSGPAFNNVIIQNTAGSGVKGTAVTDFAYTNGTINNSGTGGGANESNIAFNTVSSGTESNVSGAVSITGNSLTNALWHGVDVANYSGTVSSINVSGNTITSATSGALSKGSAIRVQVLGSSSTVGNLTAGTFSNNVISNFPSGAGIQLLAGNSAAAGSAGTFGVVGSGTNVVSVTGNQIHGFSAATRMGTSAIIVGLSGRGQGNVDVSGNGTAGSPLANVTGIAISVAVNGFQNAVVKTDNNVIAANNAFGSAGIGGGTGVTFSSADTPSLSWSIQGNTISATDGNGILAVARSATGSLGVRIRGNTVAAPLTGFRQGIRVDAGNAASVNDSVCLDIAANTSAGSGGATGIGLRKQGTSTTINAFGIQGLSPSPAASPAVETYVDGQNPAGGSTQLISATSGFTACSLP